MAILKIHSKRNKKKKLEARRAQLLAGYHMAGMMRRKRTSDLVKAQYANQHYHELNAYYKKQHQYIRAQLHRVTMMVERLIQTKKWVSASEHHHIHTMRKHWVDALCKIRYMLHQSQEIMLLFAKQINHHVAHLNGLDHALDTFMIELCQSNQDLAPFIKITNTTTVYKN